MRLQPPTPPDPMLLTFDVVISQLVGLPATGMSIRRMPTGGSEWQVVLLAEALADFGFKVGVISQVPCHSLEFGVRYIPAGEVMGRQGPLGEERCPVRVETDVVISERFGQICPRIAFNRAVFDLHDLPDERLAIVNQQVVSIPHSKIVVHSEFVRSLLQDWPRVEVIPCMVPDEFYELQANKWQPPRKGPTYVYGSSAMKGLPATIALWKELKQRKVYHFKHAKLLVCSPGYDEIPKGLLDGAKDVSIAPPQTPATMQMLLKEADGIFHVGTMPETFGIVFAQCEIAGKPARICRRGYEDALDTTLANHEWLTNDADFFVRSFESNSLGLEHYANQRPAKDFRISTHIQSWLRVLELNQPRKDNGTDLHQRSDSDSTQGIGGADHGAQPEAQGPRPETWP